MMSFASSLRIGLGAVPRERQKGICGGTPITKAALVSGAYMGLAYMGLALRGLLFGWEPTLRRLTPALPADPASQLIHNCAACPFVDSIDSIDSIEEITLSPSPTPSA